MTWITAATLAAATMGVVSVVDSHLIARRLPSVWAFLIVAGLFHLSFGLIFLAVYPLPGGLSGFTWLIIALSGFSRAASALLMLHAMRRQEVSRVIPVVNTYPVFVALLAVPLLGEVLIAAQWAAILVTVAGGVLISVKGWGVGLKPRLDRFFILLVASSLLLAVANIATKYALDYVSFWNMYSANCIVFGSVSVLSAACLGGLRELRGVQGRGTILGIITVNEIIGLAGMVLSFWAMEKGPISLVSTVIGTRPLFVFLYAMALSIAFPAVLNERVTRGVVFLKVVSIALIVGGVAAINLVGSAGG